MDEFCRNFASECVENIARRLKLWMSFAGICIRV